MQIIKKKISIPIHFYSKLLNQKQIMKFLSIPYRNWWKILNTSSKSGLRRIRFRIKFNVSPQPELFHFDLGNGPRADFTRILSELRNKNNSARGFRRCPNNNKWDLGGGVRIDTFWGQTRRLQLIYKPMISLWEFRSRSDI